MQASGEEMRKKYILFVDLQAPDKSISDYKYISV